KFHRGLEIVGQMLGFDAEIPGGEGAPDCVWSLGDLIHIVHEAKTEQTPGDPIGINDVRQAQSHFDWIKAHRPCNKRTDIICVMETPRTVLSRTALPHAKTLCRVAPDEVRTIAKEVTAALRVIRAGATTMGLEAILEKTLGKYREANLRPLDVAERLSVQEVSKMPTA
ncbi:MAG: hypothetical protein IMY80_02550, partial [Chloroflexi bacterium]|nr:hypothetical protein [Chloroflexota bacterium]